MRLIDAEELKSTKSIQNADFNSIETIREWIEKAQTIVEFDEPITEVYVRGDEFKKVLRCKDCQHWKNKHLCEAWSRHGTIETKAEQFCSYGERAEA